MVEGRLSELEQGALDLRTQGQMAKGGTTSAPKPATGATVMLMVAWSQRKRAVSLETMTPRQRPATARLTQDAPCHIILTNPEESNAFLWADRTLESPFLCIKNTPDLKQLEDMLIVWQLAAELDAEARAAIHLTNSSV